MRIERLELERFRNYAHCEVEPQQTLMVFVGPNASGKTNLLEAIHLATSGTSFRNPRWVDLITWGSEAARIRTRVVGEGRLVDVELRIDGVGDHSWIIGGTPKKRFGDSAHITPVVVFTPDDLALVKGASAYRRAAVDALGGQIAPAYQRLRRDYMRVVRQRNAQLKEDRDRGVLEAWDEQLVDLGSRLHVHRRRLTRRLLAEMAPVYRTLSGGEELSLSVNSRCGNVGQGLDDEISASLVAEVMSRELEIRRQDERVRRITLVGPHRDDLVFTIDTREARVYASQGQQRTVALAWKWAEVALLAEMTGRAPILLLDDVMSELDDTRRAALTGLMQKAVQTFVTTTTTRYFDEDLLASAGIVTMEELH